jgi:predicted nucleic acid-binding protein
LFALLCEEPGHEAVAETMREVDSGAVDSFLVEVNASELLYLVARVESPGEAVTQRALRTATREVNGLTRTGLQIKRAPWETVGRAKATGRIALGDAHAVALAANRDATLVVGADDDFDQLPVDVELSRFRDESV